MQTRDHKQADLVGRPSPRTGPKATWCRFVLGLAAVLLVVTACRKDAAFEAANPDANGWICLKCGVKLYTARTLFIGPKCPKCQQESLTDAIGYYCEKDHHLTIRPHEGDRRPIVCEQCQTPLVNAIRLPREKELIAWGATKFPP